MTERLRLRPVAGGTSHRKEEAWLTSHREEEAWLASHREEEAWLTWLEL